ncbi:phospholipid phosphatase 2 [Erinaceus europaeus]|uniref:Phospholipid phosphatase 2 n=1 Tax=Erinaceus europaeus TaxID=9365 RepID=A0A1S2ZUW1_ERIEU|nr:phospholipid phosphatase 2 [Erinaceus europaeus]
MLRFPWAFIPGPRQPLPASSAPWVQHPSSSARRCWWTRLDPRDIPLRCAGFCGTWLPSLLPSCPGGRQCAGPPPPQLADAPGQVQVTVRRPGTAQVWAEDAAQLLASGAWKWELSRVPSPSLSLSPVVVHCVRPSPPRGCQAAAGQGQLSPAGVRPLHSRLSGAPPVCTRPLCQTRPGLACLQGRSGSESALRPPCHREAGTGRRGGMERRWVFVLLDVLCLLVASLPFGVLTLVNTPYKRGFFCSDDSIRYPYRPDTVTHGLLAGVSVTATVLLVSTGEAYLVYTSRLYSHSSFNNYLAALYKVLGTFLFGAAVSQSLTDLAKYTVGRLRPNFLAVCDPDWGRFNCSGYLLADGLCQGSAANVTEARLSFYSGHSSFSMYCMVFLALYVHARLCGQWARLLRPTAQFFLVAFAVYVGYTRVSDHKHHWSDVLAGLLQGALVAGLTVRYLSDFFKLRPPQSCVEEQLHRKPSLALTLTLGEAEHNHYSYPAPSS